MTYTIDRGVPFPVLTDADAWTIALDDGGYLHNRPFPAAVYQVGERLFPNEPIVEIRRTARSLQFVTGDEYPKLPEEWWWED